MYGQSVEDVREREMEGLQVRYRQDNNMFAS